MCVNISAGHFQILFGSVFIFLHARDVVIDKTDKINRAKILATGLQKQNRYRLLKYVGAGRKKEHCEEKSLPTP